MAGAEVSPHGVILHPYCRKTAQTQRFWEGVGGCWPQWGQGTLGTLPSSRLSTPGTWVGTPAAEGFQMHQFCFLPLRMKFSMEEKLFLVPEAPVTRSWRWQGGHPISALFQAEKGSALSLPALKHQHDSAAAAAASEILACVSLSQAGKIFISFIIFEIHKKRFWFFSPWKAEQQKCV